MKLLRRAVMLFGILIAMVIQLPGTAPAQTITNGDDGTTLKQIIIYGRHGVRAGITPSALLNVVATESYPPFEVQDGYLTPHGRRAERLLGIYFRNYLLHEGLLTGNQQTDAARSYFRANSIQRSNITAAEFHTGLFPDLNAKVHSYPLGHTDPVFDPIGANVVQVDPERAEAEVQALYDSGSALVSAYQAEYAQIRSLLFDYPLGTNPVPETPAHLVDVTAFGISLIPNTLEKLKTGSVIDVGGLVEVMGAIDPFIMQYADGLPMDQVGWGRLSPEALSQQTRIVGLVLQIELLSPYLNKVQGSNAASHVIRTMEQAVSGDDAPGAFGNSRTRTVVVISSDFYVASLAGLLNLHWLLPGYQQDFCAPGGALVFELRQVKYTGQFIVRVFYTSQSLDQLRNLTPLTLNKPPATRQLVVPGGSTSTMNLDVDFTTFQKIMKNAIDKQYVQDPSEEVPPPVIHGVPLR